MKPYIHSVSSARQFKGKWEDYIKLHDWLDQTKAHFPLPQHRAILHSSLGIYLLEQVFGTTMTNSDGKVVSIRAIGEQHVAEDFHGYIPTVTDYLSEMELQPWMNGEGVPPSNKRLAEKRTRTFVPFDKGLQKD